MKVIIKAQPEDFVVKEVMEPLWRTNGVHAVYLLTKRNRNTLELLEALADRLGVPFGRFSYGARKDRRALTHQYIAIAHPKRFEIKDKDVSLSFVGRMERPMGPDLVEANDFTITVRGLSSAAIAEARAALDGIRENGFANYFDDQRFGCLDAVQGFFAEKLLKQQFNGALKIYLTGMSATTPKEVKIRKHFFFDHWRDWTACLKEAKTPFEKRAFAHLCGAPKDFFTLIKDIPRHELTLFISAYQSFLWNEMLRRLLEGEGARDSTYEGAAGEYCFWASQRKKWSFSDGETLPDIPMPGRKPVFEYTLIKEVYDSVLAANGLKQALFNKVVPRSVFFKGFLRSAAALPQGLRSETSPDELYPNKEKLVLSFRLPRGSFATMMVKAAFSDPVR